MFDRLDSLSDELLAAYLDGNTTPEENLKIWQVLQHDGQEREAFEVACNSLDIPVFFAASSCRNLCVIRSELAVLQKRGKEVTEEELRQIALMQQWYEEEMYDKSYKTHGMEIYRKIGREFRIEGGETLLPGDKRIVPGVRTRARCHCLCRWW